MTTKSSKGWTWTLVFLAIVAVTSQCRATQLLHPVIGDLDGDGKITVTDASRVLRLAVGLEIATAADLAVGDVSPMPGVGPRAGMPMGNGAIDVNDATSILRHVVGLPGGPWADPNNPNSFARIHKEIFLNSCATASCHNSNARRAGLSLEDPAEAFALLVGHAPENDSAKAVGMMRVVPGMPDQSYLMSKLLGPPADQGVKMPYGTSGLPAAQIEMVRQWIAAGARFDVDDGTIDGGDQTPAVDPKAVDVTLPVPPPDQGFQISVGPFVVPFGQEIQRDYYLKTPNTLDRWIKRIEYSYNKGSHHILVFKSDTQNVPDHYETQFGLFLNSEWQLITGAQNEAVTSNYPPGVGIFLHAQQQMDFQMHYVNTATQSTPTGRGKLVANFWYAAPGEITSKAGFLFGSKIIFVLPPHQQTVLSRSTIFPEDVLMFGLAGHYHSRGRQFNIYRWDGANRGDQVYSSQEWDDPKYENYDPPLAIKAGTGLTFEATYQNDFDHPIYQGPHADTEEHLFYFGWYYRPGDLTTPDTYDFGF